MSILCFSVTYKKRGLSLQESGRDTCCTLTTCSPVATVAHGDSWGVLCVGVCCLCVMCVKRVPVCGVRVEWAEHVGAVSLGVVSWRYVVVLLACSVPCAFSESG